MPSKRKTKKSQTSHEVPCPQEARLERIEEDMGEQKECLIRIEEKLKNDYSVLNKLDKKVDKLLDGGNNNPGLPSRISKLEVKQGIIWAFLFVTFASAIGLIFQQIWLKAL